MIVALRDAVLFIVIILTKEDAEEYCEGNTTEDMLVIYMTEGCSQRCQCSCNIGIERDVYIL